MARTMTVKMLEETRENLCVIENNSTFSMHYMRPGTSTDVRLAALAAARSVFQKTGIQAQEGLAPNRLASLINRLRHVRRQAWLGSRHYDLCEHQKLTHDMRVMKRQASIKNRIFYHNPLPSQPEKQTITLRLQTVSQGLTSHQIQDCGRARD